jgi:hypothetical protein
MKSINKNPNGARYCPDPSTRMTRPQLMKMMRMTKMPRPKSEMTSVAKTVSARLIPAHYAEWVRLGGVAWLRQHLSESMQKRKEKNERV